MLMYLFSPQIITPLQNSIAATVSVEVSQFFQGSVIAEFRIFLFNGSASDVEQLSQINSVLTNLAEQENDFMIPGSIDAHSTGR